MRSLARQQGPAASDTRAIERNPILVFAIAISIVSVPCRAGFCFLLENAVDDFHSVYNLLVGWRSQSKTDEGEGVDADKLFAGKNVLSKWSILDSDKRVSRHV